MKFFSICIALLLTSIPAHASERFLDIQEIKTKSGITAWLVEDETLPILSLQFSFIDAGAANDPTEKQGLTRLLSNTLDEGAGEYTSQQFQKALNDNSITLRFNSGRDSFGGTLKTLSKNQRLAFSLLKTALIQPRFDEEPVKRMVASNITRIQSSLSDPEWMAARIMNDVAYSGHPYALNSGGTLSSLKSITADDLRSVVKNRFAKNNLRIAVTGNINAPDLTVILDDVFGHLPDQPKTVNVGSFTLQNAGQKAFFERDIPQSVISMQFDAFGRDDPDFYALRILNYAFGGGGFGSRLMEEIREKRGLTYGIYSSASDMLKIDTLSISTSTDNKNVAEMTSLIGVEIQKLLDDGLSADEINTAKSYLIGSMPLALTSSDKISGMLLSLQSQNLPIGYLDHYANKIKDVKQDDIARVIKRIFENKNPVTVIVGNPENYEPTIRIEALPNVE